MTAQNLNYIVVSPFNPSQIFISALQQGIFEIINEIPTVLLDQNNSGLDSMIVPSSPTVKVVRQADSVFDKAGLLWILTSRVDKALKSYNPSTGDWRGYSFKAIIPNAYNDELGFGDIAIDNNGTKWIGAFQKDLIGYHENGNKIKNINAETQNMPSPVVNAVAVDCNNNLWIGTGKGLRVL